jgi:hypothetical protein
MGVYFYFLSLSLYWSDIGLIRYVYPVSISVYWNTVRSTHLSTKAWHETKWTETYQPLRPRLQHEELRGSLNVWALWNRLLSRCPPTHTVVPGFPLHANTCLNEQVLSSSPASSSACESAEDCRGWYPFLPPVSSSLLTYLNMFFSVSTNCRCAHAEISSRNPVTFCPPVDAFSTPSLLHRAAIHRNSSPLRLLVHEALSY